MSDDVALKLENVSKIYRLYNSPLDRLLDALKLAKKKRYREYEALKNVSLEVKKGERIGIIGRNGAGKTTLLKMITGNYTPTSGHLQVNGKVQALMDTGLGFHPEFTGLQNIKASLIYNGLSQKQLDHAIEDVIDFVELGDFLEQPLRTYSLGMKSRLFFATATAIKPEILIVDEVLGAGDAYFSAKSADRMKKLTQSGCTLLLVSHSSTQIIQFCERAIWMECGENIRDGKAIEVVKSYEQFAKSLEIQASKNVIQTGKSTIIQSKWLREKLLNQVLAGNVTSPYEQEASLESKTEISRWPSHVDGPKITDVVVKNKDAVISSLLNTGESIEIEIEFVANEDGKYDCIFMILLFTEDGHWLSRHCSEKYTLDLVRGKKEKISLHYEELLIGAGKYNFSAGIYHVLDLMDLSTAKYYDMLSRSFEFRIAEKYQFDTSLMHHPCRWEPKLISEPNSTEKKIKQLA